MDIRGQIKNNLLAIISLVVAFSALGYNTWRNELTEHNRNIRFAGFEIIKNLGELQRITYLIHYDKAIERNTPRDGWAAVLVLRDLSALMPESVSDEAGELFEVWKNSWAGLGKDDKDVADIDNSINDLREETLAVIRTLE